MCTFWVSRFLPIIWVGLIQSVEGLHKTEDWSPQQKGIFKQTASGFQIISPGSAACCHTLQTVDLPVSMSPCPYNKSLSLCIHILLALFVWRTLTNIGSLKICLYLHYKMECLNNFFSSWYLIDISKVYWWHLGWLLCSSIIPSPYILY